MDRVVGDALGHEVRSGRDFSKVCQAQNMLTVPERYHEETPVVGPVMDEECMPSGGGDGCGLQNLLQLLGKPYVLDILHYLGRESDGPRRFLAIRERLGVSPNTLSGRLKLLVEAGLLTRTSYNEIPPRVDYEATPKARELGLIFRQLGEWASKHSLRLDHTGPERPTAHAH